MTLCKRKAIAATGKIAAVGSGTFGFKGWAFCNPLNLKVERPVLGMGETHVGEAVTASSPQQYPETHPRQIALDPPIQGSATSRASPGQATARLRALINKISVGELLAFRAAHSWRMT